MTAAPTLAAWALGLRRRLPAPVAEAARRHLLDGLGTAIAAARSGAAAPAVDRRGRARRPARGDPPRPRRPGLGAPAAALANGTLVHALDFDDTHAGGLVHATAVVLPAVLAVGEQVGAAGRGGAGRRGGRLRDGLPDRRRRPARVPRPRPARHARLRRLRRRAGRRAADAARPRARPSTRSASPAARPGDCWSSSPPARPPSSCTPAWPRTPASSPPGSPRPAPTARTACSRVTAGCTPRSPTAHADAALVTDGPRRPLGDHPDHAQALPGLPAHARRARRRPQHCAGPLDPADVAAVDRRGAPRQRRDRLRRPTRSRRARRTTRSSRCPGAWRRCSPTAGSPSTPTTRRRSAGPRSPRCAAGPRHRRSPGAGVAADAPGRVAVELATAAPSSGEVDRSAGADARCDEAAAKLRANVGGEPPPRPRRRSTLDAADDLSHRPRCPRPALEEARPMTLRPSARRLPVVPLRGLHLLPRAAPTATRLISGHTSPRYDPSVAR